MSKEIGVGRPVVLQGPRPVPSPAQLADHDGKKVRVGEDKAGELVFFEPGEIVVLFRGAVGRLSGPGVDHEDAGIEVASGQASGEPDGICSDQDPELLKKLPDDGVEV
jgi:hypothetical protein